MNQTLDSLIRELLGDIAPDVDVTSIDAGDDVRDAADIDSVDFLNFVTALHERTGVDIPERDYALVRTIHGCRSYLEARARLMSESALAPGAAASDEAPPPSVVLRNVTRRYDTAAGGVTALADVDLTIRPGELVVVLGPSGCGKTTLLNVIGALDEASEGEVIVAGRSLRQHTRAELFRMRRETVCFIFQSFNLFPGLTALENVEFGADVARRGRRGTTSAADAARTAPLEQVGLGGRSQHFPHELSGGEQQRVAIARALATGNPVLLADEPTGELDFRTGVQILELLEAEARSGKTVLVVTHNREIARAAIRIVELSGGRVVSDGPPAEGRIAASDLRW